MFGQADPGPCIPRHGSGSVPFCRDEIAGLARNCSSDSIDKTETWHDDLSGRFESWGQTYVAGTLHSAHWKSWKKSDGSYGAKMTSAWDY